MSSVLVDQLRALALRLGGPQAGRQDSTRRFWLIARQLRAGLPPLLLAARSGSPQRRVGYLLVSGQRSKEELDRIRQAHAGFDESVSVYLRGDLRALSPPAWAKAVNLNPLNEIQAARVIAEEDLDVLADYDGRMLQAMPLLIAMHPARQVVEPAFVPPASDGHALVFVNTQGLEAKDLFRLIRDTIDALPPPPTIQGEAPSRLNARLNRGIQMHQAGEFVAARSVYEDVLAHCPQHPIAAYLLGQLLFQQQDNDGSIAALQAAAGSAPEFRDAHYTLAQRLFDAERWHEAGAAYRHALDLTPGFAAGWSGLGLASLHTHDPVSTRVAVGYLERSVALEPDVAQWAFNLGSGLQQSGDPVGAREAYRRAIQLDPEHLEARFNLGAVAHDLGELPQAIDEYRSVLDRNPRFEPAYVQLGAALLQAARIEEWLDNYRRYRTHCAESLSMATYGLEASIAAGDSAAHANWCERILAGAFPEADPDELTRNWEQLLFLLLHVDVDRGVLLRCYRRYDAAAREWYGAPFDLRAARRAGPLRIGYLSGDLRDHVMGRMIYSLVSQHDAARFQPHFYSLSATNDEWTDRFRALGFSFVGLTGMTHASAAARIRADDIDVLVDCSGHTRGAQQGILALKPARILTTHIATPGPVGLRSVDYKLTDELAESEDAQNFIIERLWAVSGGIFPWHRYPSPGQLTRASLQIPPDAFVCGAYVSLMKLSPRCLAVWREMLERIPHALIAFSPASEDWRASFLRWIEANRISRERVIFIPYRKEEPAALARYRILDVALDPLPCGNVNGTMEALACGVPVVTLTGPRHGERLGTALLNRFGVVDTIASRENDYIDLVCRLASDADWRDDLRARIRTAAIDSPVWNASSYTRGLEAAFEQMTAAPECTE